MTAPRMPTTMTAARESRLRLIAKHAMMGGDRIAYEDMLKEIDALRAALAEREADTQRLDWLAFDYEGNGPICDGFGEVDIHEMAFNANGAGLNERDAYCRGFRAAIDATMRAGAPSDREGT